MFFCMHILVFIKERDFLFSLCHKCYWIPRQSIWHETLAHVTWWPSLGLGLGLRLRLGLGLGLGLGLRLRLKRWTNSIVDPGYCEISLKGWNGSLGKTKEIHRVGTFEWSCHGQWDISITTLSFSFLSISGGPRQWGCRNDNFRV